MARIVSDTPYNVSLLNLNAQFVAATLVRGAPNINLPADPNLGGPYRDAFFYGDNTPGGVAMLFLGSDLAFSAAGTEMIGGTVTTLAQGIGLGTANASGWAIIGMKLSAASWQAAILSTTTADEQTLLATGLNRADLFTLSDFPDNAHGFAGNDKMLGNGGNDVLAGDTGNDNLSGGDGNDSLDGGTGADRLNGGLGTDILKAGNGADRDVFVFASIRESAVGAGHDSIVQFAHAQDKIDLNGIDANKALALDQNFTWSGTKAANNAVWYTDLGRDILLQGDVNGDKVADFEILLVNLATLTFGDLIL